MQTAENNLILLLISTTSIISLLALLFVSQLTVFQKKQLVYHNDLRVLKLDFEKAIISSQLEIQEKICQNIGREIHDNINLSLTLAKLHLNTIHYTDIQKSESQIEKTVCLITETIDNLTSISRGLNSEIVISYGLIWSVENEINRLREINLFKIEFEVSGEQFKINAKRELIIFRIIQEALKNILKHADCKLVKMKFIYEEGNLRISIEDDGKGFDLDSLSLKLGSAGLKNISSRTRLLEGRMELYSSIGKGTKLNIIIPQ